jgi:hypothetical protein
MTTRQAGLKSSQKPLIDDSSVLEANWNYGLEMKLGNKFKDYISSFHEVKLFDDKTSKRTQLEAVTENTARTTTKC